MKLMRAYLCEIYNKQSTPKSPQRHNYENCLVGTKLCLLTEGSFFIAGKCCRTRNYFAFLERRQLELMEESLIAILISTH